MAARKYLNFTHINPFPTLENQNILPYTPSVKGEGRNCYLCKESIKIVKEGQESQELNGPRVGMDENCYLVDAKRIRVSLKNRQTNALDKKEVIVHIDCLK